ncbi:MAG: heme exporter protein CcmB [Gemmatimonadetes bacterium]|nr:heme exporter protein CcmB [Gemmatimonadota bacterium]
MRRYLAQIGTILWKDLVVELRARERLIAMSALAVLVAVLLNYALDQTVVRPAAIAPGLLWMTIVFSGMLGFGRAFPMEQEQDQLQGILLTPIPRSAFYLGKTLANFVLLTVVELLILAVFALFFSLSYGRAGWLALVIGVATAGFAALGTLLGAVSAHTRMSDTILPLLVFPLLIPVVIHGVTATSRLMAGRPATEVEGNLRMLAAFALLFLSAGAVLFRYVVEE